MEGTDSTGASRTEKQNIQETKKEKKRKTKRKYKKRKGY